LPQPHCQPCHALERVIADAVGRTLSPAAPFVADYVSTISGR
jgi:hypothetical protein